MLCSLAEPLLISAAVLAHGIAGDRFFPVTLAIDDPFVADELSLPTIAILKNRDIQRLKGQRPRLSSRWQTTPMDRGEDPQTVHDC